MQRVLSTVVLLGLLVATAAAFAITEHLKLIKSPITGAVVTKTFSPVCGCATDKASIRIKLRHSDWLTVTIEDESRHTVATLERHVYAPKGYSTFFWTGGTNLNPGVRIPGGSLAHSGTFQPQVKLFNARRTILLPNKITVDTTRPTVLSASNGRGYFVPGDKRTINIQYAFSEDAHPVLYLGRTRIILGRHTRARGVVKWNGLRYGQVLPPGRYVLRLGAVDIAGNHSAKPKRFVVVLRGIAFTGANTVVAPKARFTIGVQTTAGTYGWRFAGKHGAGHGDKLRLRAPAKRGTYRLVVTEHGHSARRSVKVGRK